MKFCHFGKDGGMLSSVYGFWLVEIKCLFSIAVLNFRGKSREAYHTHAFDAISWVLKGKLVEHMKDTNITNEYTPSIKPIITPKNCFHKVSSDGSTWALTFRGPWVSKWLEYTSEEGTYTLIHGRVKV